MKIVAVMASHERHDMTRRSCDRLISIGCDVVLVVSTKRDVNALQYYNPLSYSNNPLGAKWQYAVDNARLREPDLLITCGSDDLLCDDYIPKAMQFITTGYEFVGVSQWYMETATELYKAWYCKTPHLAVGSGRVYTKALLDKVNWQIFDKNASRRLDDVGNYIKKRGYVSRDVDRDGLIVTAVKGSWGQLNPINRFFNAPTIGIKKIR